jgi:hypothetical protein
MERYEGLGDQVTATGTVVSVEYFEKATEIDPEDYVGWKDDEEDGHPQVDLGPEEPDPVRRLLAIAGGAKVVRHLANREKKWAPPLSFSYGHLHRARLEDAYGTVVFQPWERDAGARLLHIAGGEHYAKELRSQVLDNLAVARVVVTSPVDLPTCLSFDLARHYLAALVVTPVEDFGEGIEVVTGTLSFSALYSGTKARFALDGLEAQELLEVCRLATAHTTAAKARWQR